MKAMLEARMVAERIQSLASSLHGTSAGVDRLIVSQGVLIGSIDVIPPISALHNNGSTNEKARR
jgi:hypothetical protein